MFCLLVLQKADFFTFWGWLPVRRVIVFMKAYRKSQKLSPYENCVHPFKAKKKSLDCPFSLRVFTQQTTLGAFTVYSLGRM